MAVVGAAELDGALSRLGQRHSGAAALPEDALVGHLVILGPPAEIFRRDLLQLLLRVHPRRVGRAGHRVNRLAAAAVARPRQILRRVAPGDHDLLPGHAEELGRHAVAVADRSGPVIADPRLDVEPAVRLDHESGRRTRPTRRCTCSPPRRRRAPSSRSACRSALALVPPEQLGALVQRLLDERAGGVLPAPPSGPAGGPNSAFPAGALMRRIAT